MNKRYVNYEDNNTISKYFKDIRKIDFDFKSKHKTDYLSLSEETKLAKRILNGDKKAVDELVRANLKFVVSIAKPYQGHGLTLSDLINEGNIGLIKAANKFDYTKGFRFISYAVWWIKQSILYSLNENSRVIRLPTNIINKLHGLKKLIDKFENQNEREPVFGEIVDTNNDVVELLKFPKCASLNETINEDGDELMDIIAYDESTNSDDKFFVDDRVKKELNDTLSLLSDKEKEIIECYFGINRDCNPMTLEDIGIRFNLTKERVRQIKNKALKKLRHGSSKLFDVINS